MNQILETDLVLKKATKKGELAHFGLWENMRGEKSQAPMRPLTRKHSNHRAANSVSARCQRQVGAED